MNMTNVAVPHELFGVLIVNAASLLRAHLDDAVVAVSSVRHPAALAHEKRHGLFNIYVLARLASEDGNQRVPVVGGGNNDRLNVLIVQKAAEVAIAFRLRPAHGDALAHSRLITVGEGDNIHIRLIFEIVNVLVADESKADEADLHAVIRARGASARR